ncbi:MAG TPA: hypothetical protein VGR71_04450 [Nitrospira sp.]|nr:hypothetical protein [Nitrospira sp.]
MRRLSVVGVPSVLVAQPRQPRGSRRTGKTKSRYYKGVLRPDIVGLRSMESGRRRSSPYQAIALSSGKGVLAPRDAPFMQGRPEDWRSPQDTQMGWTTAHWTSTGFSTVQGV